MSDSALSLAFPTVPGEDAERLGAELLARLQEQGVLDAALTDCVLGRHGGYRPGAHYRQAVEVDGSSFLGLAVNGVELVIRRTVFDAGEHGLGVRCPDCTAELEDLHDWDNSVNEWYAGCGLGLLRCPSCGAIRPVTQWVYDPVWAFASLGLRFWNWPELSDEFVDAVGRSIGHRATRVYARI